MLYCILISCILEELMEVLLCRVNMCVPATHIHSYMEEFPSILPHVQEIKIF
jgi:hypothetical protein